MKRICPICGKEFVVSPSRVRKSKTGMICCSRECAGEYTKSQSEKNCICDNCGKKIHKKPSHIKDKNYCNMKCLGEHREKIYKGENNPNAFCRIEEFNKILHCGYYWIFLPKHPMSIKTGYIREHRYIAETFLLKDKHTVEINGKKYLSANYDVHHKDENKLNNHPDNLLILSRSEHQSLHQEIRNNS